MLSPAKKALIEETNLMKKVTFKDENKNKSTKDEFDMEGL